MSRRTRTRHVHGGVGGQYGQVVGLVHLEYRSGVRRGQASTVHATLSAQLASRDLRCDVCGRNHQQNERTVETRYRTTQKEPSHTATSRAIHRVRTHTAFHNIRPGIDTYSLIELAPTLQECSPHRSSPCRRSTRRLGIDLGRSSCSGTVVQSSRDLPSLPRTCRMHGRCLQPWATATKTQQLPDVS